jgi:hypothetical protein
MAVGATTTAEAFSNSLTDLAISLRSTCERITQQSMGVNGQGQGLAYLESIGFSNVANPSNPNGVSDAQYAMDMLSYLNTVASIYYGTAAQPSTFNFHQELSQIWGGR